MTLFLTLVTEPRNLRLYPLVKGVESLVEEIDPAKRLSLNIREFPTEISVISISTGSFIEPTCLLKLMLPIWFCGEIK